MMASIVDLRYKMKDVLQALRRNEKVKIYYRGKTSGIIIPAHEATAHKEVQEHPFFGMHKKTSVSVTKTMEQLRGGRFKEIEDAV
jgi:hypothetical protein